MVGSCSWYAWGIHRNREKTALIAADMARRKLKGKE